MSALQINDEPSAKRARYSCESPAPYAGEQRACPPLVKRSRVMPFRGVIGRQLFFGNQIIGNPFSTPPQSPRKLVCPPAPRR